jgi:lipoyl(octanoyl) transferase
VSEAKIASIGLKVRRGRTYHGIAFNIDMDLTPFSYINPCGFAGLAMTQATAHIEGAQWDEMAARLVKAFCRLMGYHPSDIHSSMPETLRTEMADSGHS